MRWWWLRISSWYSLVWIFHTYLVSNIDWFFNALKIDVTTICCGYCGLKNMHKIYAWFMLHGMDIYAKNKKRELENKFLDGNRIRHVCRIFVCGLHKNIPFNILMEYIDFMDTINAVLLLLFANKMLNWRWSIQPECVKSIFPMRISYFGVFIEFIYFLLLIQFCV